MRYGVHFFSALLLALALCPARALAFEAPPNDGFVTDAADIIPDVEEQALEESIAAYARETSNEIAIVTVPSLEGLSIEEASLSIARSWRVGSTKNNGILLLVAYQDRAARIEVGYGLEGAIPDIVARGIIDTDIVPNFRSAAYGTGLRAAVSSLQKHIGGEYTVDRYQATEDGSVTPLLVVVLFALFQWGLAILGRTKSWWLGGVFGALAGIVLALVYAWWLAIPVLTVLGLLLDYVVSKNYRSGHAAWWAGGGSARHSRHHGGFGGFGGGGFGGGGASGRW